MDCEFDTTSDILFPTDLPKLSSPLDSKVPEAYDWATQDFMYNYTMQPFLAIQPLRPVFEETQEEKQVVDQINRQLIREPTELNDMLHHLSLLVQEKMKPLSDIEDNLSIAGSDQTRVEKGSKQLKSKASFIHKFKSTTRKVFSKLLVI
ncbi:hypothetical protein BY458DRAFT_520104 [Sporodiniella umbellata]|nr:hypothetical protein BY458DRAFT_520104 [Sporodiniella umbellata]